MRMILLSILFLNTWSEPEINNILKEVKTYQLKQFKEPNELTIKMLDKLEFLNRHILQNSIIDSFWLINVYDNRKYFDAIIISDTNIFFESIKKDSSIKKYNSTDAKKGYWVLLDSIIKGTKILRVDDATLRKIAMKISIAKNGKISIDGFNINNLNQKVDKFHF